MYWRDAPDKIGCLNCGYFMGTSSDHDPSPRQYVEQLQHAMDRVEERGYPPYDVLELNCDGSFLNDEEIPPNARQLLLGRIASLDHVKALHVESRPEYITTDGVADVVARLRPDQRLSVGIGLESTDPFIRAICVGKGFSDRDFKQAVRDVQDAGPRASARCYILLKPAFLTEEEAVEDCGRTLGYVGELVRQGYRVDAKIEPAVVAGNTLLEVLFNSQRPGSRYVPPSTWSVIQVLLSLPPEDRALTVQVGAREDMDDFLRIPIARCEDGSMSVADPVLYEAIQQYNVTGDQTRLGATVLPFLSDPSCRLWARRISMRHSVFAARVEDTAAGFLPGGGSFLETRLQVLQEFLPMVEKLKSLASQSASPSMADEIVPTIRSRAEALLEAPGEVGHFSVAWSKETGNGLLHWRFALEEGGPLDLWIEFGQDALS